MRYGQPCEKGTLMTQTGAPTTPPPASTGERQPSGHEAIRWLPLALTSLVALVLIVLLGGLLNGQFDRRTSGSPSGIGASATSTVTATVAPRTLPGWTAVPNYRPDHGMFLAPSDPRVAYTMNPVRSDTSSQYVTRRTDDAGATWHEIASPFGAETPGTLQVFIS